jgi:excisionase family DNA binding protein
MRDAAYAEIMDGQTFNLSSAARYLGVSRITLYNMMKDGRFSVDPIPGTKPRRWNKEDLDAWRNAGNGDAQ